MLRLGLFTVGNLTELTPPNATLLLKPKVLGPLPQKPEVQIRGFLG